MVLVQYVCFHNQKWLYCVIIQRGFQGLTNEGVNVAGYYSFSSCFITLSIIEIFYFAMSSEKWVATTLEMQFIPWKT